MRVTMLGTGSAFPSGDRVQSGTVIEQDGSRLLVDCGSGILHRLGAIEDFSFLDIDTVLLTHHHLDHVSDLPGLFKARILRDSPDFTILGPPGTRDVCKALFSVDGLEARGNVTIHERSSTDAPIEVGDFRVDVAEGNHSIQSFSYRFGDALTLCGDTTVSDEVLSLADGSHTLIHECSFPEGVDTETHSTPQALAEGLSPLDLDRVYLTHWFPETEPEVSSIVETVDAATDANVFAARDLARFTIPS